MEAVYMEKTIPPVVSDQLNLKELTTELKNAINRLDFRCRLSELFVSKIKCDETTYKTIASECCINNLLAAPNTYTPHMVRPPEEGFKSDFRFYALSPELCQLKSVEAFRKRSQRVSQTIRKSLVYPASYCFKEFVAREHILKMTKGDLLPYSDLLMTVRVYCPSPSQIPPWKPNRKIRFPKISQELLVPGKITLDKLRSIINCIEDHHPYEEECSSDPYSDVSLTFGMACRSGLFYFGNDFYCDAENGSKDYCGGIRVWASSKNLNLGNHYKMSDKKIEDLSIRLGYPYLYLHQGSCEHLIVFTNARLIHPGDCLMINQYPIILSFSTSRGKACMICDRRFAKYLIEGYEKLPYDRALMCWLCLQNYCYLDHKKCGDFKLYRFVDRTALF